MDRAEHGGAGRNRILGVLARVRLGGDRGLGQGIGITARQVMPIEAPADVQQRREAFIGFGRAPGQGSHRMREDGAFPSREQITLQGLLRGLLGEKRDVAARG